jgi:lipoprotein-releasing system ATP-binding protein
MRFLSLVFVNLRRHQLRALMNSPRLLLADEPTGSLDEATADTVFSLLRQVAKERGVTVVLATHERRFAE